MRAVRHSRIVLGALAIALVPAPAMAAVIRPGAFDASRTEFVVPYDGSPPTIHFHQLSPTHFYYEFEPARLAHAGVENHLVGGRVERFTLANRPGGKIVRLAFTTTRPVAPEYRLDSASHDIVILPLGAPERAFAPAIRLPIATESPWPSVRVEPRRLLIPPLPRLPVPPRAIALFRPPALPHLAPPWTTGTQSELRDPYLDRSHRTLVLPFIGPAPDLRVTPSERHPRWVYLDFDHAYPNLRGTPFGQFPGSIFDRWLISRHPGSTRTRLFLQMREATIVVAQVSPARGWITLSAQPLPQPVATPSEQTSDDAGRAIEQP